MLANKKQEITIQKRQTTFGNIKGFPLNVAQILTEYGENWQKKMPRNVPFPSNC